MKGPNIVRADILFQQAMVAAKRIAASAYRSAHHPEATTSADVATDNFLIESLWAQIKAELVSVVIAPDGTSAQFNVIAQSQEKAIVSALIALGWTPPQTAEKRDQQLELFDAFRHMAVIAHHGGLAGMSEGEALVEIRRLSYKLLAQIPTIQNAYAQVCQALDASGKVNV